MPEVVTSILINEKNRILILKRSNKVGTYNGCWSGIAGYIEEGETPIQTALKEIKEETNIDKDNVKLLKKSDAIEFTDLYKNKKYDWIVYPFLFKLIKKSKIKIDWEHTDYRWINPSDIYSFETVPRLKEVISKLLM